MTADLAAWQTACGQLTAAVGASPAAAGAVTVTALGFRDALAAGAGRTAGRASGMPIHLYGHQAIVGPAPGAPGAGVPGSGVAGSGVAGSGGHGPGSGGGREPCPTCLERRWQAVRPGWLRDALELGGRTIGTGEPPWTLPFTADALAALAAHLSAGPAADPAPLLVLDLETLRVTATALLADSTCPACAVTADDTADAARLPLRSTPKRAPDDFRLRDIEDYPLPLPALVGPVAGMLGAGVRPELDSTTTSSVTGLFTLRSGDYLRETYWGGHTGDYDRSLRVGVLEGLERFAGMRPHGRRTRVVASLDALGDTALDPRTCGTYTADFHAGEPTIRPFAPDREIPWVWGWSLRDHRPVLVPEVLTYYSVPGGLSERFVQESSNGCASGGCLEEAVYFGLMEVIERDAFLLAWYGKAALAEIDAGTVTRPASRALIDRLALIGYTARFFDARVSFPVPVVTAVAVRSDGGLGALCFGAGASLDPEEALAAGLSEIATDAGKLRGRTERDAARLRALAADFEQVRSLQDHPLLYGLPEMRRHAAFLLDQRSPGPRPGRVRLADLAGGVPSHLDLRDDLEWTVGVLAAKGFDVIAVDQTSPEQRALGLATASVLVPGLIPIDFGWRRQRALTMPRLRTAFREAGRADRDLETADLNLAPHPFP